MRVMTSCGLSRQVGFPFWNRHRSRPRLLDFDDEYEDDNEQDLPEYQSGPEPLASYSFRLAAKPLRDTGNGTPTERAIGYGIVGITSVASCNAEVILGIYFVHYPSVSYSRFVQEDDQFVMLPL